VASILGVLLNALANKPCLMSAAIFFTLVVVVVAVVVSVPVVVVTATAAAATVAVERN